ncbi:MAG TPA: SOS response-associated peptidase [Dehalococcoidia bacterium]|nr:SOS response-associated peptidase [Dehalococcoidia bacterium]
MCNRFTLTLADRVFLAAQLGVPVSDIPEEDYRPRYNIAPTDWHWILRVKGEDREVLPARWGLVNSWTKEGTRPSRHLNARAETLAKRGVFKDAFERRRCAIPADGFFEWRGPPQARQPIWYHKRDGGLLLFAGLYESWRPRPDEWERTFTIVTTAPNRLVAEVHDRMPVVLEGAALGDWLFGQTRDAEELLGLLRPAPEELLIATPVSPRVNSVRNDDPACLEPMEQPAVG